MSSSEEGVVYDSHIQALLDGTVPEINLGFSLKPANKTFKLADLKDYPVLKPTWPTIEVKKLEVAFPYILAMIRDGSANVGLTMFYQIARCCSKYKYEESYHDLFKAEDFVHPLAHTWEVLDSEEESKYWLGELLENMDDASKSSVEASIKKMMPQVTIIPEFKLSPFAGTIHDDHKLAYLGMFSLLLLRSLVNEPGSLRYLYQGYNSELNRNFRKFYGKEPPYAHIPVNEKILQIARTLSKVVQEARLLLLMSAHLFSHGNESQKCILDACFLQKMHNFGLPALKWAQDAHSVSNLGSFDDFLNNFLHPKTVKTIDSIREFCAKYPTTTRGSGEYYQHIAKILDSAYFSELGRDANAPFIVGCYLIKYYESDAEGRARIKRYKLPNDSGRFGYVVLRSYIEAKSVNEANASQSEEVAPIGTDTEEVSAAEEEAIKKQALKIYEEAMCRDPLIPYRDRDIGVSRNPKRRRYDH